jgi:NAD(P)-dependent dehydrogenase (short-subunit alcohol dehydrogenase family)
MGELDGRVAIITRAGRGLGREYAMLFARDGAQVVVNDLGGSSDGHGHSNGPAQQVVAEIEAAGGVAIARRPHEKQPVAGSDALPSHFGVADSDARQRELRRLEAQELLDRAG